MKIYTAPEAMRRGPCPDRTEEILGDGLTIGQILDLDIPVQDRVRAGVDALDPRRRCAFAAATTRRACDAAGWSHSDSLRAIEAAEALGRGEEVEGIEEIRAAALRAADTAYAVAAVVARTAAAYACFDAARAAARAACAACATFAAAAASRAAAGAYVASAERERQIDHLRELAAEKEDRP